MKNEYTHCLIRTLSLDRAYDPAMGNLIMRFARPGTQRIKVEAPPVVRRDVVFTHSVDAKDRSSQTNTKHQNSVATEGLNRYNGAQRGAKACKAMAKAEEAARPPKLRTKTYSNLMHAMKRRLILDRSNYLLHQSFSEKQLRRIRPMASLYK